MKRRVKPGPPAVHHRQRAADGPIYREIRRYLTRGLAAGEWRSGEAIPSESALAREFGVAIGTVRRAVDELVNERIVVRQQGRGTFVATHAPDHTLFHFFHIAGRDGSRELPTSELVSFERARATPGESVTLELQRGASVFRIRNALKLGGRAVILDDITIPFARFPGLDEHMFAGRDGTIYGLYQARFGINVIRISERISAALPDAGTATMLGMAPSTPSLAIRRVAYTYHDQPVELRMSCVNTADHEYVSDLWKDALR